MQNFGRGGANLLSLHAIVGGGGSLGPNVPPDPLLILMTNLVYAQEYGGFNTKDYFIYAIMETYQSLRHLVKYGGNTDNISTSA